LDVIELWLIKGISLKYSGKILTSLTYGGKHKCH